MPHNSLSRLPIQLIRIFFIAATLFGMLSFISCNTATKYSIEDAKRMAVEIDSVPFTPPARNINDIIEKFDSVAKFNSEQKSTEHCEDSYMDLIRSGLKSTIDRPSAPTGRAFVEIPVFMNRANEAFMLGMHQEAIELVESIRKTLANTVWVYSRGGTSYILARYYAFFGDMKAAQKAKWAGDHDYSRYGGKYYNTEIIPYHESHAFIARASIAHMNGDYLEAEYLYYEALKRIDKWHKGSRVPIYIDPDLLKSDLGDVLMRQGRLIEAEAIVRNLLNKTYYLNNLKTAYISRQLAEIFYEQGRYNDAEWLSRLTISIYKANCANRGSVFVAFAQQLLAETLVAQGQWEEAIEVFDTIRRDLHPYKPEIFNRLFSNNPDWALSLLKVGQVDIAVKMLETELKLKAPDGENNIETAEIRGLLGIGLRLKGERKKALDEFRIAIRLIENRSHKVETGERNRANRSRRLVQILESYIALLFETQDTRSTSEDESVNEAFKLAQLGQNNSVQTSLSASSARIAAKDSRLADLIRREQDLGNHIHALQRRILSLSSQPYGKSNSDTISSLKKNIKKLNAARLTLLEEVEKGFPKYSKFVSPNTISIGDIQTVMSSKEAVIAIFPFNERTYIWAIPSEGKAQFSVSPIGQEQIWEKVRVLRMALSPEPHPKIFGDIPEFDLHLAFDLYNRLLMPVKDGWINAKDLLIVAPGFLGQLPFSLLTTADTDLENEKKYLFENYRDIPWLVRNYSITRLASISSFFTLRTIPETDSIRKSFAGFGDPIFNKQQMQHDETKNEKHLAVRGKQLRIRGIRTTKAGYLDDKKITSSQIDQLNRLPDTAEEIKSIANTLDADPIKDIFLGVRASEQQVKTNDLSDRKVIAFASHALVPGDLDGLTQPAIALSAPSITGDSDDGLLTMSEILGLKLNADWVILSACNTGAANGAGAEVASGLGRAFFYAGCKSLLASMWPVETTSARRLTTKIFQSQKEDNTLSRGRALQKAILDLIDNQAIKDQSTGKIIASYAHPIFWAPFIVVGDGR